MLRANSARLERRRISYPVRLATSLTTASSGDSEKLMMSGSYNASSSGKPLWHLPELHCLLGERPIARPARAFVDVVGDHTKLVLR